MSFGSTFVGDPFGEEKSDDQRVYGEDIREQRSIFPFEQLKDCPPCKNSNVSFMKIEELPKNCRNIVGFADESYITYSVTQKRNLLRLIDIQSGEKSILRGHQAAILDLQVSRADSRVFCTVDNGTSEGTHVALWQNSSQPGGKMVFDQIASLPLPATLVAGHPKQRNVWAITDKRNVAVFSTATLRIGDPPRNYEDLQCHASVDDGLITDMVFSNSGRHLVCVVNGAEHGAYVQVFSLIPSANETETDLIRGTETLHKVFVDYDTILRIPALLSLHMVRDDTLVTVSRVDETLLDDQQLSYEIKAWTHSVFTTQSSVDHAAASFENVQSVVVGLPQHVTRFSMPSSSLINSSLEVSLNVEKKQKFLVLTSRKSAYAVYVAIAPTSASPAALPFYHVSLIDLKAPTIAFDATLTLARDHHSSEQGEHLELTVFQEEANADGQASILQYIVLTNALAPQYASYLGQSVSRSVSRSPGPFGGVESLGLPFVTSEPSSSKGSNILNMLKGAAGSVPPSPSPAPSDAPFAPAVMTVDRAGLDSLSQAATKSGAATPAEPLPAPALAVPGGVEGLKKIDGKSLFAAKQVPVSSVSAPLPPMPALIPVSLSAAALVSPPPAPALAVPLPSQSEREKEEDAVPEFLRAPSGSTKLMSLLRGAATTSSVTTAVSAPAVSVPVVSVPAAVVPIPAAPVLVPPPVTEEKSVLSVPVPVSVTAVAVAPAVKPAVSSAVSLTEKLSVEKPTVAVAPVAAPVDLSPVLSLLQSMQKEMQSMQATHQRELQAVKDEFLAQSRVQEKKIESVVGAVKTLMDMGNKRIIESAEASKLQLTAQLNDTLMNKTLPALTQKIRETTQSAVKETIKTTLSDSFRTAFESSLLPAFQAGIDRMFAQVNGSFEQGLKSLTDDVLLIHQEHMQSHDNLEQEVQNLREDVQQLQENVGEVSVKMDQGVLSPAKQDAAPAPTPMELLKQGKISEALRLALEAREIDDTVALLSQLTLQQVNSSCSSIVRLCLVQQLAVEMTLNIPKEGLATRIQWIKNLVLTLVRIPASEIAADAVLSKNFKVMIQAVFESMQAARALIEKAHFDDGEEVALEIPQSVELDMQLLELVIQNKMQQDS